MALQELPQTQWAQVVEKHGSPAVYKRIPVPRPAPNQVLINVKYSGVCHTDLKAMMNDFPVPTILPVVGGHEGVGVVVAKGELVTNIEIGDHAGIKFINSTCGSCEFCSQAVESICPKAKTSGYTVDGTFQQYALVSAEQAVRIPKDCDMAAIAPLMCAGITVYKGLKDAGITAGETVAIVGAGGGLGSLALQYAKAMGFRTIAVDGGEEKRVMCKDLGAEAYIDYTTSTDIINDIKNATDDGNGPHAVLLLAVSEQPFQQAISYVRPKGTIVCIGIPKNGSIKGTIIEVVVKMLTIKGTYVGNRKDMTEAIDFFRRGLIKTHHKVVGLSELQDVYDMMKEGKVVGRYVVDTSR